ncbi:MAG: hypothetical protein DWQ31_16755 [Planctomycetota bacterium]|nr:MAG: hypothetical protein DWQ31_16755 [Planctomycetota bacterium]REJ92004.1 MAG: hypothetical protein DWQ35_12705 [Planctomycetota bacterium]REK28540.1 MAG: hypothetical protein DWQ42_04295 [Planctomycetota bacterium]REK39155.1 MAG: hypothetical protein DWQ46_17880 [Planctomycetota bacterium]
MQFKRKRMKGKTQKTYKEWRSECGNYRICWRNEISSLGSARYYATVLCRRDDGFEFWDFAAERKPYRTLQTAQKACERSQRVWEKFIGLKRAPRKGRMDRARAQIAASVVGKKGTAGRIIGSCPPVWVKPRLNPQLLKLICPSWQRSPSDDDSEGNGEASLDK